MEEEEQAGWERKQGRMQDDNIWLVEGGCRVVKWAIVAEQRRKVSCETLAVNNSEIIINIMPAFVLIITNP